MASTTMIHVRIDEETKIAAAAALASMGLSLSDAVRVFLTRVVADNELPFSIKAPNKVSRSAIIEADEIIGHRRTRFTDADELFNDLEKTSRE